MLNIIALLALAGSAWLLTIQILEAITGRWGREVSATILSINRIIVHHRPSVDNMVRCDYLLTVEYPLPDGRPVRAKPIVAGYMKEVGGRRLSQWVAGDVITIRHHRRLVRIISVSWRPQALVIWSLVTICMTVVVVHLL